MKHGEGGQRMRVVVDRQVCQGHTLCNMTAPDVFGLSDEDGHAEVLVDPLPESAVEVAQRAAAACPERAIALLE